MEENDYTVYKESGFKVIGGWFNTPIRSTNMLEVGYRVERSSDSANFPIKIPVSYTHLDVYKRQI